MSTIADQEEEYQLRAALEATGGSKARAAHRLGLKIEKVHALVRKHGMVAEVLDIRARARARYRLSD